MGYEAGVMCPFLQVQGRQRLCQHFINRLRVSGSRRWTFVRFEESAVSSAKQSEMRHVECSGFTLMELLIVISIVLILMLMAVPTIGSVMKHANEISAINSLQAIVTAELMYQNAFPQKGFTCSLTSLGGDPSAGLPTSDGTQLIQPDLASGNKSGYNFAITKCVKSSGGPDHVKGFTITAVPETVGKTGDRGFCIDQNGGSPKYDPAGGTSCTQWVLQ